MIRSEYKTISGTAVTGDLDDQLTDLGAEGWEVLSVSTTNTAGDVVEAFVVLRRDVKGAVKLRN